MIPHRSLEQSRFSETASRGVGAGGGRQGWECLMGTELQFGKIRKSWR